MHTTIFTKKTSLFFQRTSRRRRETSVSGLCLFSNVVRPLSPTRGFWGVIGCRDGLRMRHYCLSPTSCWTVVQRPLLCLPRGPCVLGSSEFVSLVPRPRSQARRRFAPGSSHSPPTAARHRDAVLWRCCRGLGPAQNEPAPPRSAATRTTTSTKRRRRRSSVRHDLQPDAAAAGQPRRA